MKNVLSRLDNTELALVFIITIASTVVVMLFILGQPVFHPPYP